MRFVCLSPRDFFATALLKDPSPAARGDANKTKKMGVQVNLTPIFVLFAEREGFEPPVPLSTTVFKTAAIDPSAISPEEWCKDTANF